MSPSSAESDRLPLTQWVSAKDVQKALSCSRTLAYEYLRRAARRPFGTRGLLRVPVDVWEAYARQTLMGRAEPEPKCKPSGITTSQRSAGIGMQRLHELSRLSETLLTPGPRNKAPRPLALPAGSILRTNRS